MHLKKERKKEKKKAGSEWKLYVFVQLRGTERSESQSQKSAQGSKLLGKMEVIQIWTKGWYEKCDTYRKSSDRTITLVDDDHLDQRLKCPAGLI